MEVENKSHHNIVIGNDSETGITEAEHHNIIIGQDCKVTKGCNNIVIGKGHIVEGDGNVVITMTPQYIHENNTVIIEPNNIVKCTSEDILSLLFQSLRIGFPTTA